MANNVLLTPQVFTRLVLLNLGGYLAVCQNMTKRYNKEFAKAGAKIGDTISVRKPQRFQVTRGLTYQPQPLTNIKTSITVNDVAGVHFEWDSVERTLSLDDIQENYAKPAAIACAHDINSRAAQYVAQNTYNAVGTPGTTPTTVDTYLGAGDKIVQLGLPPEEELTCIINRKMSSQYVIGQKTLFNPAGTIGSMIKKGEVVDQTLGYSFKRDQTLYVQTTGAYGGTPTLNGVPATANGNNDTMSLVTNGWSNSTTVVGPGDRFTIAGVHSVHPQTRQSTGDLQQFVVLQGSAVKSDGSGNLTLLVRPGLTASGQYQNVDVSPTSNAALTMFGAASTASPQGLLLHKDAFAFVSIPLEDPKSGKGVEEAYQETDPETGLTMSFVRFFDGVNRIHGNRFDFLDGFGSLYPELACVIAA